MTSHPRRRSPALFLALLAILGSLAFSTAAQAGPTPRPAATSPAPSLSPSTAAPSTPAPSTAAPSASTAPCAGMSIPAQHHAYLFCLRWANNDAADTVTCAHATTAVDRDMCASTREDPTVPTSTATPSVLGGTDGKVHCEYFDQAGTRDPASRPSWQDQAAACRSFTSYLQSHVAHDRDTAPKICAATDLNCQIQKEIHDAINNVIGDGVQGVVTLFVNAAVSTLGDLATMVFATSTLNLNDATFYGPYNMVAGAALLIVVALLIWSVIRQALSARRPGPVTTLVGTGKAVLGVTYAGGIAWAVAAFWDQLTDGLIRVNQHARYDPGAWVKALTALAGPAGTAGIALLIALFAVFGLDLTLIIMLFRSMLFALAACYGCLAMAGQASAETHHWGRSWFFTTNALAATKFFIALTWIYGSRAAVGSDNLLVALSGLAIIWAMVCCPYILLRLSSMVDGYLADPDARGLLAAGMQVMAIGDLAGRTRDALLNSSLPGGAGTSDQPVSPASLIDSNFTPAGAAPRPDQAVETAAGLRPGLARDASRALEQADTTSHTQPDPGTSGTTPPSGQQPSQPPSADQQRAPSPPPTDLPGPDTLTATSPVPPSAATTSAAATSTAQTVGEATAPATGAAAMTGPVGLAALLGAQQLRNTSTHDDAGKD
jgi:hypothetical protein